MSPAHVLEPTYDALRRRLLSGAWPSGHRLEAARLALEFDVSITPVRDSLNRLTGEQLVASLPGEGFHVPRHDETDLCAMLDWHHALIRLALEWPGAQEREMLLPKGYNGIATRTALLFAAAAGVSENGEVEAALSSITARLNRYRLRENEVITNAAEELDAIEGRVRADDRAELFRLMEDYHRRRRDVASRLVRLTY